MHLIIIAPDVMTAKCNTKKAQWLQIDFLYYSLCASKKLFIRSYETSKVGGPSLSSFLRCLHANVKKILS